MSRTRLHFPNFLHPIHPSWSFYATVWGIILGIISGLFSQLIIFYHPIWLIAAILIILFTIRHTCLLTLLLAFIAGLIIGNYRINPDLISRINFSNLVGQSIVLDGTITDEPTVSSGQVKLHLGQLSLHPSSNKPVENYVENFAGTVYIQLINPRIELERSDRITIEGEVGAGFGTFAATFYRPELKSVSRSATGDIFSRFKQWFAGRVRNFIASPAVDLGLGYLVGMKSGLPDNFSDALSAVGMTHVVVASGAHLGILIGAAKKIFGRISRFSGLIFSLLLILAFVLIVGFTPSMTRAALVTSLGLVVGYVGRKFTPLRLLSLVAALTLLLVPTNFENLGWQLSFASFFGIMILAPRFQKLLYGGKRPPWLASMLITSISTSLICAPILIYNFGSISVLSLLANLIILPTLPYAMLLVFLTGCLSFYDVIAQLLGQLTTLLLDFHIFLINFLSEQKIFIFELPSNDTCIYYIYLPIILILALSYYRESRHRLTVNAKSKLCQLREL